MGKKKMKDAVIIVSGGMDSITLLYDKKEEIALGVSFDYGSNHNAKEIPFANMHCKRLGIPHITINLDFIHQYFKSSLLEGAQAIPEGNYDEDNMKSTVVPFRNGIMLSIAAGIAESHGLKQVLIANHNGDHTIYPDCRPEFIKAIDQATVAGTFAHIRITAPYTNISKADIARIGKRLGINYAETWSCYKGGEKQCGKCGTCRERKDALKEAGIKDLTEYEDS
jgi:7-cyano-7-deazaguanine synthase